MEKRKIQKTGGTSFTITLPKKWIEECELREKDTVTAVPRSSGALVVTPDRILTQCHRQVVDLERISTRQFRRQVIAAFIAGADEIAVKGQQMTKRHRDESRKAAQMLTGFEVIEESSDTIILKNLLVSSDFPYEETLRKMFPMTRCMFEDALEALQKSDKELASDVVSRDYDIDKAYFLITRLTNSLVQDRITEEHAGVSLPRAHYLTRIAYQIERIADHAAKIAGVVESAKRGQKTPLRAPLVAHATNVIPLIDETAFLDRNNDIIQFHKTLDALHDSEHDMILLYARAAKSGHPSTMIVADSINRLRGYTTNMAEIALEKCMGE